MKYFLIIVFVFGSLVSFGQINSDSVITYKDGNDQFELFVNHYIFKLDDFDPGTVNEKMFYSYNITIDKDGLIKRISICSFEDSARAIEFCQGIKQTSGNWINKSGEDQIINLTIYFEVEKRMKTQHLPHSKLIHSIMKMGK